MAHQSLIACVLGAAAVIVACTSTTEGTGTPGAGGASGAQVSGCKASCDKMKFFKCNSAEEQARCYGECDGATASQIELFNACAGNSICDPACRTSIAPKQPSGSGSGSATGGGGATAASCEEGCGKLVECNFIKVGEKAPCVSECTKSAYQYQINCVVGTTCDKIAAECGTPGEGGSSSGNTSSTSSTSSTSGSSGDSFNITRCQSACDSLQFFDCLTATELSTCRDLCTTAAAAKRDTFTSCGNGAGSDCTKGGDCFTNFQN